MAPNLRVAALLSLAAFATVLGASWDWFDVDEFANLQQAQRANEGLDLYTRTPSNHPPLYTEPVLRILVALPGSDLLAARLGSVLLVWGAGVLLADLYRRRGHPGRAALFLSLWTTNGFLLLGATRAMNETLVLFLLTLAYWTSQRGLPAWLVGSFTTLAAYSRLTTVFFAPALLLGEFRRAGRFLVGALASAAILLLVYGVLHPGFLDAFLRWAVFYHASRAPEGWDRKLGKALWWSALPLLATLAWFHRPLLRRDHVAQIAGWTAALGSLLLVLLPSLHVHYFLPLAPVVVAATTEAVHAAGARLARLLAALMVAVTLSHGLLYVPMTPHHDLARAERVGDWIEAHTEPGLFVLTDAPEYAILAGRSNVGGYYWSLRDRVDPATLNDALPDVSVVIVSNRFGHYDRGFPAPFLESLRRFPCTPVEDVHVYWTGSQGPPPDAFVAQCPTPAM